MDVDMDRRRPENLMETILGYAQSRGVQKLAVESNNFQELLVSDLRKRARERNLYLEIIPLDHKQDKVARIQSLEPFLKSGQIQLSHKHRALIEQLKYFPRGRHDDGPDALEMLYQIAGREPSMREWVMG